MVDPWPNAREKLNALAKLESKLQGYVRRNLQKSDFLFC